MSDAVGQAVTILLCLVLVGSALIARRLDGRTTLRLVVLWVAIFAGVTLIIRALCLTF